MIAITDNVIDEITSTIGAQRPETGGALFGPANTNLISYFSFDQDARTTTTTYTPSQQLIARIPEIETCEQIVFKGIIHSHPGSFNTPSGPDLIAFKNTLDQNPRLQSLITPIVNFAGSRHGSNLISLGEDAGMRIYQAFRSVDGSVELEPAPARRMAINAAMRFVTDALTQYGFSKTEITSGHCLINGTCFLHRAIENAGSQTEHRLDFYFASDFPSVAPLVCRTHECKRHWLPLMWSLEDFTADALSLRLHDALSKFSSSPAPKEKELIHGQ